MDIRSRISRSSGRSYSQVGVATATECFNIRIARDRPAKLFSSNMMLREKADAANDWQCYLIYVSAIYELLDPMSE